MTGPRIEDWVGRTEERQDQLTLAQAAGMAAALDWDKAPAAGDEIPPGWHWMLFNPVERASALGPDGHPRRGGFLPPVELPRRMWAGGRLEFHRPLRVGEAALRQSEIVSVDRKQGRSGDLVFVLVRHRLFGPWGLAMSEEHDIVYREAPAPGAPPARPEPAPGRGTWRREIHPDPVLLFRYSALTFNGHRIHYDHAYVTTVEGYPGLVVHGPLIATLLMDLAVRSRPDARLVRFGFRGASPVIAGAPFSVNGAPAADGASARLWAAGPGETLAMSATAAYSAA